MNYAKGIETARTRRGLSKRKLAMLIGVDPSYVTHLEAGKKTPSLTVVELIARALDIPVALLMLLSSDDVDLRGIEREAARTLGEALLTLSSSVADAHDDS